MLLSRPRRSQDAKQQMLQRGFCHVPGHDFAWSPKMQSGFHAVKSHFAELPRDPYGREANRFRQLRRYSWLSYSKHQLSMRPDSASSYEQSLELNDEAGGFVRRFDPIPEPLAKNEFIKSLIKFDFQNSLFAESDLCTPIDVGLHFIRLLAEPNKPGLSVPDCLHKDGEPFTWIHLVDRVDVFGGESVIADNNRSTLIETTLSKPMDTIGVVDERVYHQVKRVEVHPGAQRGYRDVILIDFTPMIANPVS